MVFVHDPETEAINATLALLADLPTDAQHRVMDYLTQRFNQNETIAKRKLNTPSPTPLKLPIAPLDTGELKTIGLRIRSVRKQHGVKQAEFAHHVNMM